MNSHHVKVVAEALQLPLHPNGWWFPDNPSGDCQILKQDGSNLLTPYWQFMCLSWMDKNCISFDWQNGVASAWWGGNKNTENYTIAVSCKFYEFASSLVSAIVNRTS